MAQPATTAKIEELRFKLKTDPKSRLFYQLAEELRRAGHFDESEQVLRSGLQVYPTYLAAWVSLGRTLREQKNDAGAVDALNKALQLDPGNVVAARILADAYLALGEKIEAIKKYKLVHALLPSDEDLRVTIEQLERDLQEAPEPVERVLLLEGTFAGHREDDEIVIEALRLAESMQRVGHVFTISRAGGAVTTGRRPSPILVLARSSR